MNFFDGQTFYAWGMQEHHLGTVKRQALYYGIQYNHSGGFYLQIDGKTRHEATGPYVFITHPGAFFNYGPLDKVQGRSHNFICSLGSRMEQYIAGDLLRIDDDAPVIPVGEPERFLHTMRLLIREIEKAHPAASPRAVWIYEDLLLQLRESRRESLLLPVFHREELQALADQIRRDPEREWDFAGAASKLCISDTYFRRLFHKLTGFPPRRFVIECRLQKAARLLMETKLSVAAAGAAAGIPDEFYFSRLFKRKYRQTPFHYRKEGALLP